jgi:hypothetical protein
LYAIERGSDAPADVYDLDDPEARELWDWLRRRRFALQPEQDRFAMLCDRWDNLYYPQSFTRGGASHWAEDPSAAYDSGKVHISVNSYPPYVDIPAALQSYQPIENMVPTMLSEQGRQLATLVERIYMSWKDRIQLEQLSHKACVTKCLYGRTAARVTWNNEESYPVVELVDQPRNLYLGWRSTAYEQLEWALYVSAVTPDSALEDWGLHCAQATDSKGKPYLYIVNPTYYGMYDAPLGGQALSTDLRVEVSDYWYRVPRKNARIEAGKPVKFETWNAIFVGNYMVKNKKHTEYRGQLPYIPLFNSYVPGQPEGRSSLHDVEQLLREKDERLSENAQMIHRAVAGQLWQLTGPEAPAAVPPGLEPQPNKVLAPGAGNRLEALQPWMPEFQIEQFLARLDRELTDISGLNELMRGMAPAQVMNSGKAIAALVANYETRVKMPRDLYYKWRLDIWRLAAGIWAEKNTQMKGVIDEASTLLIQSPSLTPRDDAEMSSIALNLKEGKLWSAARAMDRTGVDDPEAELDLIRAEQTDATINPASVQVMVSLMAMLQQMQQAAPPQLQQAGAEAGAGMAEQMAAMRGLAPQLQGTAALNEEGVVPETPPEQMPGNTPEGAAMGANGPEGTLPPPEGGGVPPSQMLSQYQIVEGEAQPRIVGQSEIQSEEGTP